MNQPTKYFLIALAVALALAAAYFSFRAVPNEPRTTEEQQIMPASGQLAEVSASSLYLPLSDMKGNPVLMDSTKLIFINVWATWCGPCVAEMPSIEALHERYKGNPKVAFYIVSDENPETVRNFLDRKKYGLPFYLYNGQYPAPLNGNAIPRTYIIRSGQVVSEQIGSINWNDPKIFEFIDQQLAM